MKKSLVLLVIIGVFLSFGTALADPYFPLDVIGTTWTYQVNGGAERIVGVLTSPNAITYGEDENIFMEDASGVWNTAINWPGGGRVYSENGILMLPSLKTTGIYQDTILTVVWDGGAHTEDWHVFTEVIGSETVTVPFGTFESLLVRNSFEEIGDTPVNNRMSNALYWFVEGLGIVKGKETKAGGGNPTPVTQVFELTNHIEPTIDATLVFFDESVEEGMLEGDGSGKSANGRLNALRNMLEMAGDLINIGDIEGACVQLKAALQKCNGDSPPPDFVVGDAVAELYDMIFELREELGCE